ncbi:hypothetical protein [Aeromicrobium sp. 179-A 4D2 NHS]|uniref:hypothetical protein n=1 Tax=Aeromicrobium sp. 179-A 4D2 NHS TaxID=3142375 RepID=UPI0039A27BBA
MNDAPFFYLEYPASVIVSAERLGPRGGRGNWDRQTFETKVRVRAVRPEDAPVAFTIDDREYRYFEGKFWTVHPEPVAYSKNPVTSTTYKVPARTVYVEGPVPHEADLSNWVDEVEVFDNLLFIDDIQWSEASEPVFYAQTFGMGHNHGGTSLSIGSPDRTNGNRYRLDEFEEARAHAVDVAADRGDTESVTRLESMDPPVVVHDASLLTYQPPRRETKEHRSLRYEFTRALEKYAKAVGDPDSELDEKQAWKELVQMRQALLARGGVEAPR